MFKKNKRVAGSLKKSVDVKLAIVGMILSGVGLILSLILLIYSLVFL